MNETVYYIENCGCDDTTHGLVRISDEDFPKFKEFIENLNKNSHYGCMPTIDVYKVSMDEFREVVYIPGLFRGDDGWVDRDYLFHLDGKTYTFTDGGSVWNYYKKWECVIVGRPD